MKWFWYGAYVSSRSQAIVETAVRTTVEKSTDNNMQFIPKYSEYEMAAGALQFIGVSPQKNGWTAFWGMTPRFCSLVIEWNHFTGLLLYGGDKLLDEATDYSNYWFYMIWIDGLLQDWFILNPKTFFSYWSDDMLETVVYPYLASRGAWLNPDLTPSEQVVDLIQQDSGFFHGELYYLKPYVRPGIEEEQIQVWKDLPAYQALHRCADILDIPFLGPNYDPLGMAVYHDVIRGNLSPNPQDYAFNDPRISDIYNWAKSNIEQVEEIQPLAFQWVDGKYRSDEFLRKYNDIFYWG